MDKIRKYLGLNPLRSLGEVTPPFELVSWNSSLGLPLGLEAPVMTPNGVVFLFSFSSAPAFLGIGMTTSRLNSGGACSDRHASSMMPWSASANAVPLYLSISSRKLSSPGALWSLSLAMALATSATLGFGKGGDLAGSWGPRLGRRCRQRWVEEVGGGGRWLGGPGGGWVGDLARGVSGCREGWVGGFGQ